MSLAYSRVCTTTLLHTLHHAPTEPEVDLWSRYPEAPFVAVSDHQRRLLHGLNVVATIHHAVDTEVFAFVRIPKTTCCFSAALPPAKVCSKPLRPHAELECDCSWQPPKTSTTAKVAPLVNEHDVVFVGEVDRRGGEPAREARGL